MNQVRGTGTESKGNFGEGEAGPQERAASIWATWRSIKFTRVSLILAILFMTVEVQKEAEPIGQPRRTNPHRKQEHPGEET